MHHEAGDPDRRQQIPDIGLRVDVEEPLHVAWPSERAHQGREVLDVARIMLGPSVDLVHPLSGERFGSPRFSESRVIRVGFLLRGSERIVGCPELTSRGSVRDQTGGAIGQRCREHRRDREAAVLEGKQHGACRADRVHDRPDVLHPVLERELLFAEEMVGQPAAAAVEQDQAAEGREAPQEHPGQPAPPDLTQTEGRRHHDQVDRSVACDLVRDVDAVDRLGVVGLGCGRLCHGRSVRCARLVGKRGGS